MPQRIEDYAMIGDCHTAALVGRDGSIDWLCLPRFDSPACFAALLGSPDNGRWKIAPKGEIRGVRRRYRPGTLILETEFETADGVVEVIDFMPVRDRTPDLARIVRRRPRQGADAMRAHHSIRLWFDRSMGSRHAHRFKGDRRPRHALPRHAHQVARRESAYRGRFHRYIRRETMLCAAVARFGREARDAPDANGSCDDTEQWWKQWADHCPYQGPHADLVLRSLIILKALTYLPTGGMVAAPTTSLPEFIGGPRNWDYRFCWIRDATFTLYALMLGGFTKEAIAWQQWLLRRSPEARRR